MILERKDFDPNIIEDPAHDMVIISKYQKYGERGMRVGLPPSNMQQTNNKHHQHG